MQSHNKGTDRTISNIQKSVALITGASSGIGRELAYIFSRNNYDLILVARNKAKLEQLANDLKLKYNTNSWIISADLSNPNAPMEIFQKVQQLSLKVDVLVNNAGFGIYGKFHETQFSEELDLIQVNMVAPTHLTKLFLGDMLKRGKGKILNVASTAAFQPGPLTSLYFASKAYLYSFSQAISAELKNTGVTVSVLCPGPTITEFHHRAGMKRMILLKRLFMMKAKTVAEVGFRGLMRNKTIIIPGLINKFSVQIQRFLPRILPILIIKFAQKIRNT